MRMPKAVCVSGAVILSVMAVIALCVDWGLLRYVPPDGTLGRPYTSIREALKAIEAMEPSARPRDLWVHSGVYDVGAPTVGECTTPGGCVSPSPTKQPSDSAGTYEGEHDYDVSTPAPNSPQAKFLHGFYTPQLGR